MAKFFDIPLNPFASDPQTRTTIYIPPIDSHLKPHAEQIAKEVRLVESARNEALENRPKKDDRDLDQVQLRIVARVEEGANLLRQFGANQMNTALVKIRAIMPKELDTRLALAGVDAGITQAKVGLRDSLESAREDENLALRRLTKFKRDNELGEKDAFYSDGYLGPSAMLILLLTVETAANAVLLQAVSPLGYTGGFMQALLFGAVNVALGFTFGFLSLRLLGHIKLKLRILGAALGMILWPIGVFWSLIVANYRQVLETNRDAGFLDPERLTATTNWLYAGSAESWALLLLGILIYLLAASKGRGGHGGFWDPYLGYKPVHLAYRRAQTTYSDLKLELRNAIHAAILGTRDALRIDFKAEEDAVNTIQKIAAQAEERAQEVTDSVGEWSKMGMTLIARYREENAAIRTDTTPAYFAVPPTIPVLDQGMPSALATRALAERAKEIHQANVAVMIAAEHKAAQLIAAETEIFLGEMARVEERADKLADEKWREQVTPNYPDFKLAAE